MPSERVVLFSYDIANYDKKHFERLAEIMFEDFEVPAISIMSKHLLSLFAAGKTTGCVLHSGDGVTSSAAIYEGYLLSHTIEPCRFSGCDITENFLHSLSGLKYRIFEF